MRRFSIITVCYNEEKRIRKTLESVYCQSYQDYEHIIEDGGSTDRTLSIISECSSLYSERQLQIYSEKDDGLYDAMNRAIKKAKGDYICFINSGDFLMDAMTLERVAAQMDTLPGMDWYYGSCVVIFPNGDEYLQVQGNIENISGRDISGELKSRQLSLIHQAIFAHRNCFINNLFDIKYSLRAELKWYYKCLLARKKVKRLEFPVCKYSLGGYSERISSVEINARETREIFNEMHLRTEENEKFLPKGNNYGECYRTIYNQWLALRQAGITVADYLLTKGVKRVAIYGYAELGTHLVKDIVNTEIQIDCLIDQKERFPYSSIRVVKPDEFTGKVDLVIVTSLLHFDEIRQYLNKRNISNIISLEDLLEDMWEY